MLLDPDVCERARLTRDARFDGRFFTGVLTTGVYCRPICPVRSPKAENVRFYPTAAAAAEAGFRPCLRCRPEAAPGTPAWLGTAATVTRALRLIAEGALDHSSVNTLAERLGIGPRHLVRLFDQHVGASPIAVAQTRRLHFAKKLIDETELPLAEIAFAAGFGSVRRFNAVFQQTYQRAPSSLRCHSQRHNTTDEFVLRLPFRPPFAWPLLLAYFRQRATPGVEAVDQQSYRRTFSLNGQHGWFSVQPLPNQNYLELRISFPDSQALLGINERIRRQFDLDADPTAIADHLSQDLELAPLIQVLPGLRVPGAWDGFELAVRAILGQQVSVAAATTLAGRLATAYGEPIDTDAGLNRLFPTPQALAETTLIDIGLPTARARAIQHLAQAVCEGDLSFSAVADPSAFAEQLMQLPGIGRWTADYVALRALNEPDAFPSGDLGLLRAVTALNLAATSKTLVERAEIWRPWRAYAAVALWHSITQESNHVLHLSS